MAKKTREERLALVKDVPPLTDSELEYLRSLPWQGRTSTGDRGRIDSLCRVTEATFFGDKTKFDEILRKVRAHGGSTKFVYGGQISESAC